MRLENERVNRDKYYFIGYSPELNKYILACAVAWIVWYHRYYEISKEEYDSFGSAELDKLADTLYKQGCNSERFLFSEKKEENNQNQLDLCE
ncbi:MAG: ABC transporter ATP-binding protein [Ruminococcus sp.]|nr:ABC transporter ATP-binding protein [Ruminococcus sp.]